jgi:hypothetical protein
MEGPDHIDPDNTSAVCTRRSAVQAAEGVKQTAIEAAGNSQSAVRLIPPALRTTEPQRRALWRTG